jgi:hypothetical protein
MAESTLGNAIGARFLDRLTASPRGRAFIFKFLVGAEEGDEAGVFDHLLARVDDPALHKIVRIHRDDETRHAEVFRACLARQGVSATDLPEPIPVVPMIDRRVGGLGERFVADRAGVMEAYVLLQVIEERGAAQYPRFARAMARRDPRSAEAIMAVVRDEERHIKYANAVSRRYAPDATTLARTLERYRVAEAAAFVEHGRLFLAQAVAHDLLAVSAIERWAWRGVAALQPRAAAA